VPTGVRVAFQRGRSVSEAPQGYVPGVCNIGPAEVTMRRRLGWIGLALTIGMGAAFIAMDTSRIWRIALFVPAVMAAAGFVQSAMHFCAAYGLMGLLNVGLSVGHAESVELAKFRRQDRRKAIVILGTSLAVGVAVSGVAYVLPW